MGTGGRHQALKPSPPFSMILADLSWILCQFPIVLNSPICQKKESTSNLSKSNDLASSALCATSLRDSPLSRKKCPRTSILK